MIEGAFIGCLILIVLSNISFVGLKYKYKRASNKHALKVSKVERHHAKFIVGKSISQYARISSLQNLAVNIMNVHLPTLFANVKQAKADARIAQDLQIIENQQEELNQEESESSSRQ